MTLRPLARAYRALAGTSILWNWRGFPWTTNCCILCGTQRCQPSVCNSSTAPLLVREIDQGTQQPVELIDMRVSELGEYLSSSISINLGLPHHPCKH